MKSYLIKYLYFRQCVLQVRDKLRIINVAQLQTRHGLSMYYSHRETSRDFRLYSQLITLTLSCTGGDGGVQCTTLLVYFYNSKNIRDIFLVFLDFLQNRVGYLLPKNQGYRPFYNLFCHLTLKILK